MNHRVPQILWVLIALASALPQGLRAQAFCSAPHSSPTLAGSGSLRTLPVGGGWIQLSALGLQADEFFDGSGDRLPFLAGTRFDTRSVFVTGAVGLLEGLELWAQVPIHRLTVEGNATDSRSSGVGDLRFAARVGAELLGWDIPFAVRFGAKFPGSEFPVDATELPLSEGQRDWEVSLESGIPLGGTSLYLMGWTGFRWREENSSADRQPGDEIFAHLALGGSIGPFAWELAGDGLWGQPLIAQGFVLPDETRRLIQLLPTVGWAVGRGRFEASGQIPVSGQNLPAALGVSLGYRVMWGMGG